MKQNTPKAVSNCHGSKPEDPERRSTSLSPPTNYKPCRDPANRSPHTDLWKVVLAWNVGECDGVAQPKRRHVTQVVAKNDPYQKVPALSPLRGNPGHQAHQSARDQHQHSHHLL